MRTRFPPNYFFLVLTVVAPIAMAAQQWGRVPVLSSVCCVAVMEAWALPWMVWGLQGVIITEAEMVRYVLHPRLVVRRTKLARISNIHRTRRATYITTVAGREIGVPNHFVLHYAELLPALRAAAGSGVKVVDER